MKDSHIQKPGDLDAALLGNAMLRRERLWRVAEGRSFHWADLIGVIAGLLLILISFYKGYFDRDDVTVQLFLGFAFIGSALFRYQQSQIAGLRDLLRLMERQER
jgi:hypothetical protein